MSSLPTARGFDTVRLLRAYERAIDENIISSITDAAGTIVHVNQKFCETSQYSEDELVGENHRIVNSGHHPASFFKGMWQTIGKGGVWHGEVKNKAKDGSFYWVDTVVVPMRDDAGRTTHYFSLRTLITARKELELGKQRQLDGLQALLVMTSMRMRKPLSECMRQLDALDAGESLDGALGGFRATATELESFTQELTSFIRDMEVSPGR